jgi:hypothetical protein
MPIPQEGETAKNVAQLFEVGRRILAELAAHEPKPGEAMPEDVRDAANFMLGRRTAELVIAAADDFHFARPQAGTVMGRSILETALALRWCLRSQENAERWWREGDAAIQRAVRRLGLSTDPKVVALRAAPHVGVGLPGFPEMAKVSGLTGPYQRWYSVLSAYSHPSRMATVHAYSPKGGESPEPLIMPCIYFANDVGTVVSAWATRREVPPIWPHP